VSNPKRLGIALLVAGLACAGAAWADVDKGNVDELRFGASVDAEGVVPPESAEDELISTGDIHISMKVQEAKANSNLMLTILDRETEEVVWSEEQKVPGGKANMHFTVAAGKLNPGKYRAKVKLVDEFVAEHEFEVK
jgi:hypothetical protein